MKKTYTSIFMAFIMLFTFSVPAFAQYRSCYMFTHYLTQGAYDGFVDGEVTILQAILKNNLHLGNNKLRTTSYFGPVTKYYLKVFQAKYGLSQTGAMDPSTRYTMYRLCGNE